MLAMFIVVMSAACCFFFFFFSSRRRHTRLQGDWSSDVCSSDLPFKQTAQALLPLLALAISESIAIYLGGPGALSLTMPAMLLCAMRYRLFVVALLNLVSCPIKLATFSHVLFSSSGTELATTFSFGL